MLLLTADISCGDSSFPKQYFYKITLRVHLEDIQLLIVEKAVAICVKNPIDPLQSTQGSLAEPTLYIHYALLADVNQRAHGKQHRLLRKEEHLSHVCHRLGGALNGGLDLGVLLDDVCDGFVLFRRYRVALASDQDDGRLYDI